MIRHILVNNGLQNYVRLSNHSRLKSSTTILTQLDSTLNLGESEKHPPKEKQSASATSPKETDTILTKNKIAVRKSMVETVFTSLKSSKSSVEESIKSASTVNALLSTSELPNFSRFHALNVVSILSDWAIKGKVKLSDFESDPRFDQLCRRLGRKSSGSDDLVTVLGITGDDEAARLITKISTSQMIRVMSALAYKRRRSPNLLKALTTHLNNSIREINVKEAADILYAMSVLNFTNDELLANISSHLCSHLPKNKVPAIVGSVLTSLGILRYKDTVLLETLVNWINENYSICRVQDIVALLLTSAAVNYHPQCEETYKKFLPILSHVDTDKPHIWLDVVWALVVLRLAEHSHIESVLNPNFLQKLKQTTIDGAIPVALVLKLLNINAAVKLMNTYSGPLLSDSPEFKVKLQRSQGKQVLVESVLDSLTNLLPSKVYLKSNVDSGFGFLIDADCALDKKCNPVPVDNIQLGVASDDKFRVAIMVCDYHDMCRGKSDLAGPAALSIRLLEQIGYKILVVPYMEFSPRQKLVTRVKYLEKKLKTLIAECS